MKAKDISIFLLILLLLILSFYYKHEKETLQNDLYEERKIHNQELLEIKSIVDSLGINARMLLGKPRVNSKDATPTE